MRASNVLVLGLSLLVASACGKEQASEKTEPAGEATASAGTSGETAEAEKGDEAGDDAQTLADKIGVEPGPWEYGEDEAAIAVVSELSGEAEVRRVGSEEWQAASSDTQLHEGDQFRTKDDATATIVLVDETAVELVEQSAVSIGSREAARDPASSIAVLYGVARFSVADRAEGEGPFLVYTQAGIVATKGTVYTVGVIATGAARVGVESGEIEVAGGAKLSAPVVVPAGKLVVLAPAGEVSQPEPATENDWGAWRDEQEASIEAEATAKFHAERIAALEAELEAAYAELETQAKAAAEAEASAQAAADAGDQKAYVEVAPTIGGSVDASFALSGRLHFLTNAMVANAYVAGSLSARHPAVVEVVPAKPLAASVLWNKRYHAVAHGHVRPLRHTWYVHHPEGRARAKLVRHEIPPFFAKVKLTYQPPDIEARVKMPVYRPPRIKAKARGKVTFVGRPATDWHVKARAKIKPRPVKVKWYVRPEAPKSKVLFGVKASGKVRTVLGVRPAKPRVASKVRFEGGIGVRDHRSKIGGSAAGAAGVQVRDHRSAAGGQVKGAVTTGGVEVRDHRSKVGADVKAGVKAGVGTVRDNRAKVGGSVKAGVQGPAVKVRDKRGAAGAAVKGTVKAGATVRDNRKPVRDNRKDDDDKDSKAKGEVKGSIKVKGGVKLGN